MYILFYQISKRTYIWTSALFSSNQADEFCWFSFFSLLFFHFYYVILFSIKPLIFIFDMMTYEWLARLEL